MELHEVGAAASGNDSMGDAHAERTHSHAREQEHGERSHHDEERRDTATRAGCNQTVCLGEMFITDGVVCLCGIFGRASY